MEIISLDVLHFRKVVKYENHDLSFSSIWEMIITKQITNYDILYFVFCDLSPAPRFNTDGKEENSQIMIPCI